MSRRNWRAENTIMNNPGFGDLVIIKNGAKVTVPESKLTILGTVNDKMKAKLECLTVENIKDLESEGVVCEINMEA